MSKDLQQQPQPQSEEVDLGQLFKLLGNMFDRLFQFIASIFKQTFHNNYYKFYTFKASHRHSMLRLARLW